ncbi:MAG: hypothetical protein P3W97_009690, partial [Tepidimonas sp.]|nr:hypothetical protein [Tepidimonas sp.]
RNWAKAAEAGKRVGAGVLCHSDRGSQYASQAMTARLSEYGMTAAMRRKGDCWDNRSRCHCTLGYSSPVRFLENWIRKHAAQQSKAG